MVSGVVTDYERAALLEELADLLDAAKDGWDEAASLPGWPADGCSQGCVACFAKWLRIRAAEAVAGAA